MSSPALSVSSVVAAVTVPSSAELLWLSYSVRTLSSSADVWFFVRNRCYFTQSNLRDRIVSLLLLSSLFSFSFLTYSFVPLRKLVPPKRSGVAEFKQFMRAQDPQRVPLVVWSDAITVRLDSLRVRAFLLLVNGYLNLVPALAVVRNTLF